MSSDRLLETKDAPSVFANSDNPNVVTSQLELQPAAVKQRMAPNLEISSKAADSPESETLASSILQSKSFEAIKTDCVTSYERPKSMSYIIGSNVGIPLASIDFFKLCAGARLPCNILDVNVWTAEVLNSSKISKNEVQPKATSSSEPEDKDSAFYSAQSELPAIQSGRGISSTEEIMDVLTQADEQSRIPERDSNAPITMNRDGSWRKRRRRRRKWCCCCCRRKKSDRESNAPENQTDYDSISSSESGNAGCLGLLDSRSSGTKSRTVADDVTRIQTIKSKGKMRRTRIPDRPNYSLNLWSLLKNSLGKELSKIPMPVNFNEPLSMLQRLTEDYEYSDTLDRAAQCTDSCEQMCHVAAFTISSYATTSVRTAKPFNPLLGETFEFDRSQDLGWQCISEQVSHHPPTAALHCKGKGWACWQEFTMTSKFKGNSLEIIPLGIAHLTFENSGNHYTWRKVTTVVRNIIVGKLWVEQVGDMVITNHTSGDKCQLSYIPYSMFNKKQKEVTGTVKNSAGVVKWTINGSWDTRVEGSEIKANQKPSNPILFWARNYAPAEAEKYYNFTQFAVQLNEMEEGVAPTDSRRRPDQRLMEDGKWDEANAEKLRLEEKQRVARKFREGEAASTSTQQTKASASVSGDYHPAWFKKQRDPVEGTSIYTYKDEYWQCKRSKDWSRCPDIF